MSPLALVPEMAVPGPTCIIEFDQLVRNICTIFGGSVTGGPRTEKRNRDVGGHENSRHLWKRDGSAADVMFDTPEGYAWGVKAGHKCGLRVVEYKSQLRLHFAALGDWIPK